MKPLRRSVHVLLSIMGPIAIWLGLVAVGPWIPQMGLVGALFDLFVIPAILVGGFWLLAQAFPRRRLLLACVYFPVMIVALIYLGAMLAWRLYPETF